MTLPHKKIFSTPTDQARKKDNVIKIVSNIMTCAYNVYMSMYLTYVGQDHEPLTSAANSEAITDIYVGWSVCKWIAKFTYVMTT